MGARKGRKWISIRDTLTFIIVLKGHMHLESQVENVKTINFL